MNCIYTEADVATVAEGFKLLPSESRVHHVFLGMQASVSMYCMPSEWLHTWPACMGLQVPKPKLEMVVPYKEYKLVHSDATAPERTRKHPFCMSRVHYSATGESPRPPQPLSRPPNPRLTACRVVNSVDNILCLLFKD